MEQDEVNNSIENAKEEINMAVLEKPVNKITVIKKEDSSAFIKEFNRNIVSKEYMNSCKKAGDLFAKRK